MLTWIVGLVISAVAAAIGNALVRLFDGVCPVDSAAFCGSWDTIATVGAGVLAAFGYVGARWKARQTKPGSAGIAARALVAPDPAPEPESPSDESPG